MTVGERERGTLESLLSLPLSRSELLMGKWLAVVTITGVGVALQIAGLLFGIAFLAEDLVNVPSISIASVLLLTLAVGLYGTMIVALYLALAMRSKSVKEAGTVLTPITLAMIVPILIFPGIARRSYSVRCSNFEAFRSFDRFGVLVWRGHNF